MENYTTSFFITNGWESSLAPKEYSYKKEGVICRVDVQKLFEAIVSLKKYFRFQMSNASFVNSHS